MIDVDKLIEEISDRLNAPWNNGTRISADNEYKEIKKFLNLINYKNDMNFGYSGDLYRIHTPYSDFHEYVDLSKNEIISDICSDGSCSVLPITEYDGKIVSFSKSYDFTKSVYYKVAEDQVCNFIHINTLDRLGIDINKIIENKRFEDEQEVLFPLRSDFVVKEYKRITPKEFKEIMNLKHKNKIK